MTMLEPLHGQTLGMQAADAIRRLIATGHLVGGERLIEARIAEQLGISRGSVRDALWLLRGQGLVRDEPRRGSFVAAAHRAGRSRYLRLAHSRRSSRRAGARPAAPGGVFPAS